MKNKAVAIFLKVLLIGALAVMYNTQKVGAEGTIYIRADGSVYPPDAPISSVDNVTYTFTGNIYETIVVQRDNITIDGNGYLLQGAGSGTGFDLSNRNNVTIKKTHITGWDYGVHLYNVSCGNIINDNNLTNNTLRGIFVSNSSKNIICNNKVVNNIRHGIFLWLTNTTTVTDNNASNNGEDGISIAQYSFNNTITNNTVFNNSAAGISLPFEKATGNLFTGNNIAENGLEGIYICWTTASNNTFYHNNLNNTIQVSTVEATNTWDSGYPSGGNYWSDYNGEDLDGDGIGDTPHVIDENNQDNYPFINPWTPQAYDVATLNVTPYKTVVGQNFPLHINATVANQGSYTQTFNITAHANNTTIQTQTVTLSSGNFTTVTFTWNTTDVPYGNYTISTTASTVPGEIDTDDNISIDDTVFVTIPGDVDGDGDVDPHDFALLARAYGTKEGDSSYNPDCDLDGDGDVDPDDFAIFAGNYGKTI